MTGQGQGQLYDITTLHERNKVIEYKIGIESKEASMYICDGYVEVSSMIRRERRECNYIAVLGLDENG